MDEELNKLEELKIRSLELQHRMQAGIGAKMAFDTGDTEPKHLRVGVNSAIVEHGALVKLLFQKGIITEEEYFTALVKALEEEIQMYEDELSEHYGTKVTLR